MTQEIWKPIQNYNGYDFGGNYEVSSWGNIRNTETKKLLKTFDNKNYKNNKNKNGYLTVTLYNSENKKRIHVKINRLVAFYFLEVPANATELDVNHIDGNKKNNSYTNLEFITRRENIQKAAAAFQKINQEAAK